MSIFAKLKQRKMEKQIKPLKTCMDSNISYALRSWDSGMSSTETSYYSDYKIKSSYDDRFKAWVDVECVKPGIKALLMGAFYFITMIYSKSNGDKYDSLMKEALEPYIRQTLGENSKYFYSMVNDCISTINSSFNKDNYLTVAKNRFAIQLEKLYERKIIFDMQISFMMIQENVCNNLKNVIGSFNDEVKRCLR